MKNQSRLETSKLSDEQEQYHEGRDVLESDVEHPEPEEGAWLFDKADSHATHDEKSDVKEEYIVDLTEEPKSHLDTLDVQYSDDGSAEQIEWAKWAGEIQAAEERYEAGVAAQQADGLLDAIDATLKARTAGEGTLAATDKMVEYLSLQASGSPEQAGEKEAVEESEDGENPASDIIDEESEHDDEENLKDADG